MGEIIKKIESPEEKLAREEKEKKPKEEDEELPSEYEEGGESGEN